MRSQDRWSDPCPTLHLPWRHDRPSTLTGLAIRDFVLVRALDPI
jgi:hypothetical protein